LQIAHLDEHIALPALFKRDAKLKAE